jgi:outer membrane protein
MFKPGILVGGLLSVLAVPLQASSLLDLFQESMASDPRLIRAEAESAIYQAREDYAFGGLLPQVSLGGQTTRTSRDATSTLGDSTQSYYDGKRYYLSLTQPLYDKAKWEAFRSADRESEQYGARLEEMRSLIAVDLVDRYTRVLGAEDNHAFVVAEKEAAEKQLKLVNARYERKLARITDVLSLEARANVLGSREIDAQNQVTLAREDLSEVLGRIVDEPLAELRDNLYVPWDLGHVDDWIRKGLAENSQLQASYHAVETARARVKEASGRRHPTVNLSLSAQESDIGFENAQSPEAETMVAAVNVNMPLYSGGQISAQVAEAKARLRLVEQEYVQMDRTLRKSIREAYLNARSAQERVDANLKALKSAEKSYEAQQKGFEYGTVTVVDVLNASELLFEAKRDYHQAFYDLMLQRLTLFQVAGQFSPAKIAEADSWLVAAE